MPARALAEECGVELAEATHQFAQVASTKGSGWLGAQKIRSIYDVNLPENSSLVGHQRVRLVGLPTPDSRAMEPLMGDAAKPLSASSLRAAVRHSRDGIRTAGRPRYRGSREHCPRRFRRNLSPVVHI